MPILDDLKLLARKFAARHDIQRNRLNHHLIQLNSNDEFPIFEPIQNTLITGQRGLGGMRFAWGFTEQLLNKGYAVHGKCDLFFCSLVWYSLMASKFATRETLKKSPRHSKVIRFFIKPEGMPATELMDRGSDWLTHFTADHPVAKLTSIEAGRLNCEVLILLEEDLVHKLVADAITPNTDLFKTREALRMNQAHQVAIQFPRVGLNGKFEMETTVIPDPETLDKTIPHIITAVTPSSMAEKYPLRLHFRDTAEAFETYFDEKRFGFFETHKNGEGYAALVRKNHQPSVIRCSWFSNTHSPKPSTDPKYVKLADEPIKSSA